MIIIFFSFESIQIAYTDTPDPQTHILISQKSHNVFEVIKQGVKLRTFLQGIALMKNNKMVEQESASLLQSPVFICHSCKSKKVTQPILQLLSPSFERQVLYITNDKTLYSQIPFTRALFVDRQICYGQGYAQLRAREELRLAAYSIFATQTKIVPIFIEKLENEMKELKKEGFVHIVNEFELSLFQQQLKAAQTTMKSSQPEINHQLIMQHPYAQQYILNLIKAHKDIAIKQIAPLNISKITTQGFIRSLYHQGNYFNMTPKSWAPFNKSKEVSSYVFHNASNNQLYLAKASKLRQFSNEEDYQKNTLAYCINFIINPNSYALPHDKISSLIKFSKIKAFQNKKALFNVRPYVEGLTTISQIANSTEMVSIFERGQFRGMKVVGVGSLLLTSLLLNQNLHVKSLSQQISFIGTGLSDLQFLTRQGLLEYKKGLYLCRTDFHNVLDSTNYKEIDYEFIISNKGKPIKLRLQDLHPNVLDQFVRSAFQITQQKLHLMKSLTIYYRWNTQLIAYFHVIHYRIQAIIQYMTSIVPFFPSLNPSLLVEHPVLSCLLLGQDYSSFVVPRKNIYSNEHSYGIMGHPTKQPQNPYYTYINKVCSFAIYNICFPVHSFLQWIKSTNKYQIIEYMSMINHSLQEYVVMDKRLKLMITNEKKNAILVVDHVQLCEALINRPKSIKTVMIMRLKKINQIDDVGIISTETQAYPTLKQSEDQIIKVLMREGAKHFKHEDEFQLYDWVLRSYIQAKCQLYDLDYNAALNFLQILHKAISTNRHRIKQIKENHPNLYIYLYTLPIIKDNQKIIFNYKLFQYIHAYQLFQKISKREWKCRLQSHQNSSVLYWKPIMSPQLVANIVDMIIQYLQQLEQRPLFQIGECQADCLELIRSLTQSSHPYYNKVFAEHLHVHNYNSIITILHYQQYIIVEDDNSISISSFHHNKQIVLDKETETLISFCIESNTLFFLAKVKSGFKLQPVTIISQSPFSYNLQEFILFKNVIMQDLIGFHPQRIYLHKSQQYIFIVLQFKEKVILAYVSTLNSQELAIKQYDFGYQIVDTYINNSKQPYLICVTIQSIYTIAISTSFQENPTPLKQLNYFITSKTTIVKTQAKEANTQLIFFQNHRLQIICITNRSISQVYNLQLPQTIKAVTIHQDILFVFYASNDSLFIYQLRENSYKRINRYYWVDNNAKQLYVSGDIVVVRGGSYLKKVRVGSIVKGVGSLQGCE